jgi:hypothetical protein
VQRYDPQLDIIVCGPERLDGVSSNDRIPFNGATDMIPTWGFYGSTNLFDYLYPLEVDEVLWEGARIMRTEDLAEDYSGEPIPYVSFTVCYDYVCMRASLRPRAVDQVAYIALAYRADGEIDGVGVTAVCYDAETQAEIPVPCTTRTVSPIAGDGTGNLQYLVYKLDPWQYDSGEKDEDYLTKLKVQIDGLDEGDALYLTELSLFATEADMCAYTGLEPTEPLPEPDTDPETEPETEPDTEPDTDTEPAPETDVNAEPDDWKDTDDGSDGFPDEVTSDVLTTTASEPDQSHGEGCSSAIGLGAVAILTAMAAVAALKRRGD